MPQQYQTKRRHICVVCGEIEPKPKPKLTQEECEALALEIIKSHTLMETMCSPHMDEWHIITSEDADQVQYLTNDIFNFINKDNNHEL